MSKGWKTVIWSIAGVLVALALWERACLQRELGHKKMITHEEHSHMLQFAM